MSAVASTKSPAVDGVRQAVLSSWVAGLVIVLSFVGPWLATKSQSSTGDGSILRQLVYILAFVAAVVASRGYVFPKRLLVIPIPIAIILVWCVLSLSWSVAPAIGMRRLILTSIIIWTIFIAVANGGYDRSISAMGKVLIAVLVVNYLTAIFLPQVGRHMYGETGDAGIVGDWRGVLFHKNFCGPVCAFTMFYFALGRPNMKPIWRWLVFLAAAFFLYKTMSKTSLGLTVLGLLFGWAFRFYKPRYGVLAVPILVFVLALVVLLGWQAFPHMLDPLQRPDALTGRGQIWPALIHFASDHPLTGAGYGSFWNIGRDSPLFDYARGWVAEIVAQGHNGYLDTLITIGVPGLILVFTGALVIPIAKLFVGRSLPAERGGFLLAMMLFCLGHNFTESSLFDRDLIVQIFLMLTIALIYAAKQEAPRRRRGYVGGGPQAPRGQPRDLAGQNDAI